MMKSILKHLEVLCLVALMLAPSGLMQGAVPLPDAASGLSLPAIDEVEFSFYGKPLSAARLQPVMLKSVRELDVSQAWNDYRKRDVTPVLASLRGLSAQMGLNDWFVFQLVRDYADGLLDSGAPENRVLLEHFLLSELGYDVRLARTERQLLLMVPFEQQVYERYYIKVGGKDYYLFYDNLEFDPDEKSIFYPCDPSRKDLGKGSSFNLLFKDKPLNVHDDEDLLCGFDDGMIHVECLVNTAVMRMLRDYPLMDIQYYASSVVLPQFRSAIQEQLIPQLQGMSQCDAADALLHFVQNVFGYEKDNEQFGGEKVNFVEESFYYDKNDCDDRSVLYAFLVQSLLGLDVQFVNYPGHECTAVHFTDCDPYGNGYFYGNDYYLICDPSYVGGTIGRCMPKYSAMQPTVKTMTTVLASSGDDSPLQPQLDKRIILPKINIEIFDIPKQDSIPNITKPIPSGIVH